MPKINAFIRQKGWIELICGPMFAGKSEELLRRLSLLQYSEVKYLLFKHVIDTRTKDNIVTSRDGKKSGAVAIKESRQIIEHINDCVADVQVIAIDEVQFFDQEIVNVCNFLASNGYIVMAAGLDLDYHGRPFYNTMHLLAYAEKVTKLSAICTKCGAAANWTERLSGGDANQQIIVGDFESYAARCRHCFSDKKMFNHGFGKIKKPY